jgi:hypothetical protein
MMYFTVGMFKNFHKCGLKLFSNVCLLSLRTQTLAKKCISHIASRGIELTVNPFFGFNIHFLRKFDIKDMSVSFGYIEFI